MSATALGIRLMVRNSLVAYSATPPASTVEAPRFFGPSSSRQLPVVIVAVSVTRRHGMSSTAVEVKPGTAHFRPAASMPRSSFFRSWISSRIRAASSNCRSRAAAIICSVRSLIRSASSARGMFVVSRPSMMPALTARPGSPCARRPRDALRPEPPTSTSSASRYTWSRMSAIFLRNGFGSMPCSSL